MELALKDNIDNIDTFTWASFEAIRTETSGVKSALLTDKS
jgi:hypothetical protein